MYRAIGMINGRWVYQKPGEDRYLEYGNKYWIASTGVGKTSGHLHNAGGSVCPEHLGPGDWEISREVEDKWTWVSDPDLEVICVPENSEDHDDDVGHEESHRHPSYGLTHRRPRQGG